MASSSDPRELTPEEQTEMEDEAARAMTRRPVTEMGAPFFVEGFDEGAAWGESRARASSPAPDAETHALLRAMAAAYDADLIREDAEVDDLFDAGLLRLARDITDEYATELTAKGRDAIRAAVASSPVPEGPRLHRTVVHVEGVENGVNGPMARCTASGVDLPVGSGMVNVLSFPESMRDSIEHGRCFFARVNLDADMPSRVRIEDIEEGWAKTDGPLHFEAAPVSVGDEHRSQLEAAGLTDAEIDRASALRAQLARAIVGVDGVAWPPADAGMAEWALRRADAVLAVVSPSPVDAERWFRCGAGHIFQWGNEDWHREASQSGGAPTHCPVEITDGAFAGESCMESSTLAGPFPNALAAAAPPVGVDEDAKERARILTEALKAIEGPEDRGHWIEEHYRPAGGGYAGLQAIARAALIMAAENELVTEANACPRCFGPEGTYSTTCELCGGSGKRPSSAAPGVTEAAREALGFYADRDNWRERNGVIGRLAAPAGADRGEKARAALAVSPAPTEEPDDA